MLNMGLPAGWDDRAGIEYAVGIGQILQSPHDVGANLPPLRGDERRHVAASSVLALECTVVTRRRGRRGPT